MKINIKTIDYMLAICLFIYLKQNLIPYKTKKVINYIITGIFFGLKKTQLVLQLYTKI